MSRAPVVALCFFAATLSACSPIRVTRDYDSGTGFSRYRTYRWVRQDQDVPPASRAEHALLEKNVKSAVDAELAQKGYRKAATGKPDFLIAWHIGARDKVNIERYGYRYGPRGRWYGTNVQVHHYKEGTLIIDFVDPDENLLVWRSTAVGTMQHFTKGEGEVQSAVHEMLKKFPPK